LQLDEYPRCAFDVWKQQRKNKKEYAATDENLSINFFLYSILAIGRGFADKSAISPKAVNARGSSEL